jgi:hypothetical protein
VNRRALVVPLLTLMAACGGSGEPAKSPTTPARPADANTPVIPAEQPPLLIEYVVIHRHWVEKLVPVGSAELKAWSDAPENAAAVTGAFRQILVKVPGGEKDPGAAAKTKAEGIVKRLEKGEDFAKLARQLSDDAESKDRGGEYPDKKLADLPAPVGAAFKALEPGKITTAPVRSPLGFHVILKERASEDRIERAFRAAKAPELTLKLAEQLRTRFAANAPSRSAIADAVEAVLGESGVNDADRPNAQNVARARIANVRLPAAAKAALETFARNAHPGEVIPAPAVDGDRTLVARALSVATSP